MNKCLNAVSALAGMTTLAISLAPAAFAQEVSAKAPFQVTLDGWGAAYAGILPSSEESAPNSKSDAIRDDIHLIIDAHSRADNGLIYGVFLRTENTTQNTGFGNTERANIYFQGDWGRLEAGDNEPPSYQMLHGTIIANDYGQPAGDSPGINNGNSLTGPFQAQFMAGAPDAGIPNGGGLQQAGLSLGVTNLGYYGDLPIWSSNATKVNYKTPAVEGIQIGVSYAPDGRNRGGATVNTVDSAASATQDQLVTPANGRSTPSLANYTDLIETAVTYKNSFEVGFAHPVGLLGGVAATYGRAIGSADAGGIGMTNIQSLYLGIRGEYAGVKLGFGYTNDFHSREYRGGPYQTDQDGFAIGGDYQIGPWVIGGYYQNARNHPDTYIPGSNTLVDEELDLTYLLAPGLQLISSAYNFDYHDDGALLLPLAVHRDGQIYLLGSAVTF